MAEFLILLVKSGVAVALLSLMFSQGLGITRSDFGYLRQRPGLAVWSVLLVIVLVPIATLLVVALVRPQQPVVIMLAILAAAPAAPFTLLSASKAGGRREFIIPLHLLLVLLAPVSVPLVLWVLATILNFQSQINALAIFGQVVSTFLLPLGLGVLLRAWRPELALKLLPSLTRFGGILLLIVLILLLSLTYGFLFRLDPRSYVAMALFVMAALAIGHWLITADPGDRIALALECATRHPGLALFIAAQNFPIERVMPVLIPYLVVFIVLSSLYKRAMKSRLSTVRMAG